MKYANIDTLLGPMIAIADDSALQLLEFKDGRGVEREIDRLQIKLQKTIQLGHNYIIESIKPELDAYFNGTLKNFKTPIQLGGTEFQHQVWQELLRIPYGETRSYAAQAMAIGKKSGFRAVANANGANQLAIIVPCHRIINSNGKLGGYAGGLERKQWLLNLEKSAG